jgi:hypothetical protein
MYGHRNELVYLLKLVFICPNQKSLDHNEICLFPVNYKSVFFVVQALEPVL